MTNDGLLTPIDALLVINELNRVGGHALLPPSGGAAPPPYLDTTGDDFVSPVDALRVINELNRRGSGGSGELSASVSAAGADRGVEGEAVSGTDREPCCATAAAPGSGKATSRTRPIRSAAICTRRDSSSAAPGRASHAARPGRHTGTSQAGRPGGGCRDRRDARRHRRPAARSPLGVADEFCSLPSAPSSTISGVLRADWRRVPRLPVRERSGPAPRVLDGSSAWGRGGKCESFLQRYRFARPAACRPRPAPLGAQRRRLAFEPLKDASC